jgi:hypothetical protein
MTENPETPARPVERLGIGMNGSNELELQLIHSGTRNSTIWFKLDYRQMRMLHNTLTTMLESSE